ncbi:MAG TPA: two-component regulator propeller domain-containing protein [Bacteroidota bacterium]|nr:two-component regulator propeller domain-containing protein [Bacteroidota bacterium]
MISSRLQHLVRLHLAALFAAASLVTSSAFTQPLSFQESWRWGQFTTESGLPSNHVFCFCETENNTLWAGTARGIAWCDGFAWHAMDTTRGIPAEHVSVIESYRGDSVFCIIDGSLYLGDKEHFRLLISKKSKLNAIQSVAVTNQNEVLVLGSSALCRWRPDTLIILKPPAMPVSKASRNLWRTSTGTIWLNTVKGLYRMTDRGWALVMPMKEFPCVIVNVVEDLHGNGVAAVAEPREAVGIREWSRGGMAHVAPTEQSGGQLAMDVSPSGDVLVFYETGEIRLRHKGAWSAIEPRPEQFGSTLAMKFSKNGDLRLGTEAGIFRYRVASSRWTTWVHPFGDPKNGVHEITQTSDGSIWLGTFDGLEIHRPNGRITYVPTILGTRLRTVTAIAEDKDKNVWVGSGANFSGVFRWDGKSWKHFGAAQGLMDAQIHKIRKDRRGDLWFLGLGPHYVDAMNQPGAFQYKDGVFHRWKPGDSLTPGLINGRVYAFAEGKDGAYWFGTLGGISRFKAGAWTHWTKDHGLLANNDRIYALVIDSAGRVWFSNVGSGLGTISESDSVRYLTTTDGLINNFVWDIKIDEAGALWISTERGMSCLKNDVWSNFSVRSGLSTPVLMDLLPTRDRVYVGSPGAGVNILNRTIVLPPPRVAILKPSFIGSAALFTVRVYPHLDDVVSHDAGIRFRIDGGPWGNWTTQREFQTSDLASGNHVIEVQAKGGFGDFSPLGESLAFTVEPGIFERPSVIVSLILIAGSVSILIGAYIQRKRNYSKALQKSDERFHLVANTTTDVIYDWDLANGELWINDPEQSLITGPHPDLPIAREAWMDHVHPEDRGRLEQAMNTAANDKRSGWQSEYRYLRTDGTYGHMLHRGHFEFDSSGKPVRALGSIMDISERKQAEDLSRSISKRIIEAQESERRRVSRELHDSVNQILASVKFRIESLEEQLPRKNAEIRREARKTKVLLNKVMSEIRRISRNLRPAELDDLGIRSAVRSLAEEFTERTGIATQVQEDWPVRTIAPEISVTLYRIIQESLTNVEKHAKASRIRISCIESSNEITCKIEDNGVGLRADEQIRNRARGDGLGLLDMQERLSFIGGSMEISSKPKRGTLITVHIPLKKIEQTQAEHS